MKRFVWNGLGLVSLVLVSVVLTGCVSQGEYDRVKFAQRNCEAAREQLQADLAGANNTINSLQAENKRLKDLLAANQAYVDALKGKITGADDALKRMVKVYEELAKKGIPTGMPLAQPLPPALDQALKEFASKYPNLVQYDSARGVLKFTSDVLFDLGSAEVKGDVVVPLQELAKIMEMSEAAAFDAVVVGHTDNVRIARPQTRQMHPTNWHLSVHRAISVMDILHDGGMASERLGVMGYGEFRPIASNASAENRAKNRRVEVYIVPKNAVGERSLKSTAGETSESSAETPAEETPAAPIEK
jgi:chemotaxis protein MotB